MKETTVKVPKEVLSATRMSEEDITRELATYLFKEGKLSLGKAKELAGMTLWEFQHFLASKRIPVHYSLAEYKEDLKTLKKLKRIK